MNNKFAFLAWKSSRLIKAGFCFRVFGYGLHVLDATGYEPLFSERYGFKKAYYFFGLRFEVLEP